MDRVRRWDKGAIGEVERTDQGYLRAPATISRTGVFGYLQPGGEVRQELRLPEEVFNDNAIRSFGLAPLTNGHPPAMLDARNTARYQVGSVVEPVQDGDHVAAYVQITDADAITDVENGRRQMSCGYLCDLDFTPGITKDIPGVPDGLMYDAIQRNIRGNHVALVDKGRAGSTVQLRLDGADGFQLEDLDAVVGRRDTDKEKQEAEVRPISETKIMAETQVRIDEVTYDVSSQVAEAVGKLSSRRDELESALAEAKKGAAELTARADAAEEALAAEKAAHADSISPDRVNQIVQARLALERSASPILVDVKLDEMSNDDIKRAVVVALAKDKEAVAKRLDEHNAVYLTARFDAALESWQPPKEPTAMAEARKAAQAVERVDTAEDARKRMIEYNRELGRKPLGKGN